LWEGRVSEKRIAKRRRNSKCGWKKKNQKYHKKEKLTEKTGGRTRGTGKKRGRAVVKMHENEEMRRRNGVLVH